MRAILSVQTFKPERLYAAGEGRCAFLKLKELIVLQALGIVLFVTLSVILDILNLFSLTSSIIVFSILAVCNVINAYSQLIKPVAELSFYDELTNCYNRVRLHSKIKEYENYYTYAVIFFDVNNLKKVNDVHGHEDGDKILVEASDQLKYWFRYGDLYRIGGDEFIVVVPNIEKEQLDAIVKQWYQQLAPLNAQYNDDFICDLSYGVYYKSGSDTASFEDIMNNADKQMYTMKRDIKAQRG